MIPVSFSFLLSSFIVRFYVMLILIFISLLLYLFNFFMKITFIFFMFRDFLGCSGMFRNVPECSVFQVLSTPN